MKKLLFLSFLFVSATLFAQEPVHFNTLKHSFGKIKKGKPVSYTFIFKNVSAKPVVIEVATAECGCTTPDYPKAPIAKGQTGKIKVTFNAALSGAFTKRVNVKLANVDKPVVLTIDGVVEGVPL